MNDPGGGKRVMMLIDADNVSADIVEQAVEHVMAEHGAIHVRRAYCTAESALKHLKLFKRLSIRPIVNISTGKNSTDISLAVDAIDLVIAERPQIVVIVSSDSDFAPLVCRLREKGCRVCGIGQQDKTGDETPLVYDAFVELPHRKASEAAKAATKSSDKAAGKQAAKSTAKTPAKRAAKAASKAAKKTKMAKGTKAAKTAKTAKAEATAAIEPTDYIDDEVIDDLFGLPEDPGSEVATSVAGLPEGHHAQEIPDDVRRILDAVPELLEGTRMQLNDVAKRLRAASLLAKRVSSPKLFKKYPQLFELTPEKQPNKVQYLVPRGA